MENKTQTILEGFYNFENCVNAKNLIKSSLLGFEELEKLSNEEKIIYAHCYEFYLNEAENIEQETRKFFHYKFAPARKRFLNNLMKDLGSSDKLIDFLNHQLKLFNV